MTAVWGEVTVRSNQHVCFVEMTSASPLRSSFSNNSRICNWLECCDLVADRDALLCMLDIYIYIHM